MNEPEFDCIIIQRHVLCVVELLNKELLNAHRRAEAWIRSQYFDCGQRMYADLNNRFICTPLKPYAFTLFLAA